MVAVVYYRSNGLSWRLFGIASGISIKGIGLDRILGGPDGRARSLFVGIQPKTAL